MVNTKLYCSSWRGVPVQGAVGDCWFLAGLAVISERSDLIGRVLGGNSPVSDEVGCYEVNLFKDGRWERYVIFFLHTIYFLVGFRSFVYCFLTLLKLALKFCIEFSM